MKSVFTANASVLLQKEKYGCGPHFGASSMRMRITTSYGHRKRTTNTRLPLATKSRSYGGNEKRLTNILTNLFAEVKSKNGFEISCLVFLEIPKM